MDKDQKIKRKIERRLKNRSKHTKLSIENLQKEIRAYQFNFVKQPPWNQSFPATIEHNSNDVKTKDQQHTAMEVKG